MLLRVLDIHFRDGGLGERWATMRKFEIVRRRRLLRLFQFLGNRAKVHIDIKTGFRGRAGAQRPSHTRVGDMDSRGVVTRLHQIG
jgi:hypothetical protein